MRGDSNRKVILYYYPMYPILQNQSILDQALFKDQKVTGDRDFASLRGFATEDCRQ